MNSAADHRMRLRERTVSSPAISLNNVRRSLAPHRRTSIILASPPSVDWRTVCCRRASSGRGPTLDAVDISRNLCVLLRIEVRIASTNLSRNSFGDQSSNGNCRRFTRRSGNSEEDATIFRFVLTLRGLCYCTGKSELRCDGVGLYQPELPPPVNVIAPAA